MSPLPLLGRRDGIARGAEIRSSRPGARRVIKGPPYNLGVGQETAVRTSPTDRESNFCLFGPFIFIFPQSLSNINWHLSRMSDVFPLSGISGLSFDSTLLFPLLFCLVLLPFVSYLFFCLLVHSPELSPENTSNIFR